MALWDERGFGPTLVKRGGAPSGIGLVARTGAEALDGDWMAQGPLLRGEGDWRVYVEA